MKFSFWNLRTMSAAPIAVTVEEIIRPVRSKLQKLTDPAGRVNRRYSILMDIPALIHSQKNFPTGGYGRNKWRFMFAAELEDLVFERNYQTS